MHTQFLLIDAFEIPHSGPLSPGMILLQKQSRICPVMAVLHLCTRKKKEKGRHIKRVKQSVGAIGESTFLKYFFEAALLGL